MTKRIDRVTFAVLLIYATSGFIHTAPEVAPGASLLTVLNALFHAVVAICGWAWAAVELVIGLRAWWKVVREW